MTLDIRLSIIQRLVWLGQAGYFNQVTGLQQARRAKSPAR